MPDARCRASQIAGAGSVSFVASFVVNLVDSSTAELNPHDPGPDSLRAVNSQQEVDRQ